MAKIEYNQYVRGFRIEPVRKLLNPKHPYSHKRGKIKMFSRQSRKRLDHVYMQYEYGSMTTLTYRNEFPDWETCKKHLFSVLEFLRNQGIKYLWTVEFQKRGFPHFHIWTDKAYRDCHCNKDKDESGNWLKDSFRGMSERWLKVTGQINDEKAREVHFHQASHTPWKVKSGHNYASKYASKMEQKGLPKGVETFGRWWGCSRGLKFDVDGYSVDDNNIQDVKKMYTFRRQVINYLQRKFLFKLPEYTKNYRTIKFQCSEIHANNISRLKDFFMCTVPDVVPF